MATWKSVEIKIGRYLGGERNPITGRVRDNTLPDIGKSKKTLTELPEAEPSAKNYDFILSGGLFDIFNFEIKHRASYPNWVSQLTEASKLSGHVLFNNFYIASTLENFRNHYLHAQVLPTGYSDISDLSIPAWLADAFEQARRVDTTKIPVVILHKKNKRIKDSTVIIYARNNI